MNLRHSRPLLAAMFLATMIVGCGEDSSTREEPMPVEESAFGDQVEAIKRTEDQVKEMEARKQDLDAQLREAEGESRDDPGQ